MRRFPVLRPCHMHIAPEWRDAVGPASDEEREMIGMTADPCSERPRCALTLLAVVVRLSVKRGQAEAVSLSILTLANRRRGA
ncbi:MAG TPA: hypothetical protein VF463_16815 [Sphingobium sp.]